MAEFVIARYDEPLGWLSELEPAAVTVYNKGDGPCGGGGARFAEVRCPNVGREGEAYLRHILDRYESLPTVTVFAQADITDHLAAWTAFGTRWGGARFRTKGDFLRHLAAQAAAEGISEPTEVFPCDTSDHNWRLDWNRDHLGREGEWFMADSYRGGWRRAFVDWFEAHVAAPPAAGDFSVCSCGIFAVRRDRILARPRAYYEALRSEVGWHPDPAEGHFLERAWWYVFGGGAGAEACTTEGDPAPPSAPPPRCRLRAAPPAEHASLPAVYSASGPPPPHLEAVLRVAGSLQPVLLLGDRASVRLAALPNVRFVDAAPLRAATSHLRAHYLAACAAPDRAEWARLERLFTLGRLLSGRRACGGLLEPLEPPPRAALALDDTCVLLRPLSSDAAAFLPPDGRCASSADLGAALCSSRFCEALERRFEEAEEVGAEWLAATLSALGAADPTEPAAPPPPAEAPPTACSGAGQASGTEGAASPPLAVLLLEGGVPTPRSGGERAAGGPSYPSYERGDDGLVRFVQRGGRNFALDLPSGGLVEPACVRFGSCGSGALRLPWLRDRLALPPLLLDRAREIEHRRTAEQPRPRAQHQHDAAPDAVGVG